MQRKLIYTLGLVATLGIVGVQGEDVAAHQKVDRVVINTTDLTSTDVDEEISLRKFMKEKKSSFVEGEKDDLEAVGTTYTAKRVPKIVITEDFIEALQKEADTRVTLEKEQGWKFPDVEKLKETLSATKIKKESNIKSESELNEETADEATSDATQSDTIKSDDAKSKEKNKDSVAPFGPELLWTKSESIFLHEDVHVGATRSEVLFAWGAPRAMWRNNTDGSMLWLYQGGLPAGKNITNSGKFPIQKEGFSQLVENSYSSDSLAGSNSSVGYVWISLVKGKVAYLGMIKSQDWPRFAIPAATLETFKPNVMTESDFSLMGYRLGTPFTNDPNRSWEERGKLYGQEFLGYKDVAIAYNKDHEITRVMINSSLGTTKRGISLGDSKYLLLYLYGVPDFEEPANYHDGAKGVVYGYRHPVLEHSYLLFTIEDKFITDILLSDKKKSELVSAMK